MDGLTLWPMEPLVTTAIWSRKVAPGRWAEHAVDGVLHCMVSATREQDEVRATVTVVGAPELISVRAHPAMNEFELAKWCETTCFGG